MSTPVLYVDDPIRNDYGAFFSCVLKELPKNVPGIDVFIGKHVLTTGELNHILLTLYPQLRHLATTHGFGYRFEIDVLVNTDLHFGRQPVFCPELENFLDHKEVRLIAAEIKANNNNETTSDGLRYKSVATSAVGGTFDHIHDGHKILLLMTAFTAQKSIIVGVTGPKLLVNKKYAEVMEPLHVRVMKVCRFLQKIVAPEIAFTIYQINDVCGPTGFVPAIDALIVSEETAKGGAFVNDYRKEQGFKVLQVVTVKVIGGDEDSLADNSWKGKLSSTDIRKAEYMTLHP